MDVVLRVRMQVVVPMHRGPPDHAALGRSLAEDRDEELHDPARLVRPVTEVPMVSGGDGPQALVAAEQLDLNLNNAPVKTYWFPQEKE